MLGKGAELEGLLVAVGLHSGELDRLIVAEGEVVATGVTILVASGTTSELEGELTKSMLSMRVSIPRCSSGIQSLQRRSRQLCRGRLRN